MDANEPQLDRLIKRLESERGMGRKVRMLLGSWPLLREVSPQERERVALAMGSRWALRNLEGMFGPPNKLSRNQRQVKAMFEKLRDADPDQLRGLGDEMSEIKRGGVAGAQSRLLGALEEVLEERIVAEGLRVGPVTGGQAPGEIPPPPPGWLPPKLLEQLDQPADPQELPAPKGPKVSGRPSEAATPVPGPALETAPPAKPRTEPSPARPADSSVALAKKPAVLAERRIAQAEEGAALADEAAAAVGVESTGGEPPVPDTAVAAPAAPAAVSAAAGVSVAAGGGDAAPVPDNPAADARLEREPGSQHHSAERVELEEESADRWRRDAGALSAIESLRALRRLSSAENAVAVAAGSAAAAGAAGAAAAAPAAGDPGASGPAGRAALVGSLGSGWAARRGVSSIIRSHLAADLDEALGLIRRLPTATQQTWCLGDLLEHWQLDAAALERVLGAAPTATARRRLARRTVRAR